MTQEEIQNFIDERIFLSHNAIAKVQSDQYSEIKDNLKGLNGHGRMYKILRTDIGFAIALITFVVSIVAPYFLIKESISVINVKLDAVVENVKTMKQNSVLLSEALGDVKSRVSKIEGGLKI